MSGATLPKESLFGFCVGWSCSRGDPKLPYVAVDLNGGDGQNHAGFTIKGSPIILRDGMRRHRRFGALYACERSRIRRTNLCTRLAYTPSLFGEDNIEIHVIGGDNRRFAASLTERLAVYAPCDGIVVADPNGLHIPVPAIADVCRRFPRMDVMMHLYAAKQQWSHRARHPDSGFSAFNPGTVGSLTEIFAIPRRHWLIAEIKINRGHHILFGSNQMVPPIQRPGVPPMVSITSPEGRRICDDLARFDRWKEND